MATDAISDGSGDRLGRAAAAAAAVTDCLSAEEATRQGGGALCLDLSAPGPGYCRQSRLTRGHTGRQSPVVRPSRGVVTQQPRRFASAPYFGGGAKSNPTPAPITPDDDVWVIAAD